MQVTVTGFDKVINMKVKVNAELSVSLVASETLSSDLRCPSIA